MVKTFGERIRELREERDMSLREFARKLEVSAAFVSDVELGRRHPSDDVLVKMVRVLKTSVEDLRAHDTRPPMEEIRRLARADPAYGLAFRKLIEKKVSPDQLIDLAKRQKGGKQKKQE